MPPGLLLGKRRRVSPLLRGRRSRTKWCAMGRRARAEDSTHRAKEAVHRSAQKVPSVFEGLRRSSQRRGWLGRLHGRGRRRCAALAECCIVVQTGVVHSARAGIGHRGGCTGRRWRRGRRVWKRVGLASPRRRRGGRRWVGGRLGGVAKLGLCFHVAPLRSPHTRTPTLRATSSRRPAVGIGRCRGVSGLGRYRGVSGLVCCAGLPARCCSCRSHGRAS